jgi:GTP 3',8-cyclase
LRAVRALQDRFGRRFTYVRLSVTEACNFRCTYCLPDGYRKTAPHDFLRPDEVSRLVRALVAVGVGKVRLTGGEPSVRKDLPALIAAAACAGAKKVALTTNGWSIDRQIEEWIDASLTHLNVSVDSLDQATFAKITGHDRLPTVLAGLDRALASPLTSVKLNAVLLADTTAGGFDAFADYIRTRPVAVRFIELMRTGDNADFFARQHVPGRVLETWLLQRGWQAMERGGDDGPATEYAHPDYLGRFGLIAPYGAGFCDSCNRLRVTARGKLRLCLFGEGGVDLRDLLQCDEDLEELIARVNAALASKAAGHQLHADQFGDARHLAQMGG